MARKDERDTAVAAVNGVRYGKEDREGELDIAQHTTHLRAAPRLTKRGSGREQHLHLRLAAAEAQHLHRAASRGL